MHRVRTVKCENCLNWQGNKHSNAAMCNCYCAVVEPRLFEMESILPLKVFQIPFDPHDMKYFYQEKGVKDTLSRAPLPDGVKRVVRNEKDLKLILNKDGVVIGERVADQKIVYFITRKDHKCEYYKRRYK